MKTYSENFIFYCTKNAVSSIAYVRKNERQMKILNTINTLVSIFSYLVQ